MPERKTGIYAIRNTQTGQRYIGQAVDIYRRWDDHRRALNSDSASSTKLQKAWNEFGEKAFVFEILEECSEATLDDCEQWHMVEGSDYNALVPVVGFSVSITDPHFSPLLEELDARIAEMSPEDQAALLQELEKEEREEKENEARQEAREEAATSLSRNLCNLKRNGPLSAAEVFQVRDFLRDGIPDPAFNAVYGLEKSGQVDAAIELLLLLVGDCEARSAEMGGSVEHWYYGLCVRLAILYKKNKRYDDEVAILERCCQQPRHDAKLARHLNEIEVRLDKCRQRKRK